MQDAYTDDYGYLRFSDSDRLIHRYIAYNNIYLEKGREYLFRFSLYIVHHINFVKKHNFTSNLMILTKQQHQFLHDYEKETGIKIKTRGELLKIIRQYRIKRIRSFWRNLFDKLFKW